MSLRIGSLFSGYGGLDVAVAAKTGGEVVWHAENDKHASLVLAHRFPGVPNLGDVSAIDWATVPGVDILTGGFPCQDLSHAGKRAGLAEGTRSGLWRYMAAAIDALRPTLVVIENVRGILTAKAHSDLESCEGCVGNPPRVVALRALGCVLGDLADLGYDARWKGVRASDAHAPHQRFRIFIVAQPADADRLGLAWVGEARSGRTGLADDNHGAVTLLPTPQARDYKDAALKESNHRPGDTDSVPRAIYHLLPTPKASASTGPGTQGRVGGLNLQTALALLPTPAVNDMGAGKTIEEWDEWTARMKSKHGNGNGHGKSLAIEALRSNLDSQPCDLHPRGEGCDRWGKYAPAMARWEAILGRPAPEPAIDGRLNDRAVEFMMGLPEGHVTDVPGVPRTAKLKLLGNGVVPQQAALALEALL